MKASWKRNNAIHSGGDYLPHEETPAVLGAEDRYCDECAGKRSHLPGCPVRAEIEQQRQQNRERRAVEERRAFAAHRRATLMATKKGRATL